MKWLLSILLTIQTSTVLIHPPIPKTTQVAIVVLKQPQSDQEINRMVNTYKDIKLRRIFREALNGFSIEGNPDTIAKLSQQERILRFRLSPNTRLKPRKASKSSVVMRSAASLTNTTNASPAEALRLASLIQESTIPTLI